MNKVFVASQLIQAADALEIEAAKQEVRSENWEKIVMYLQNGTNCSAAAKSTTNKEKATEKAVAQHSFEKKLKEIFANPEALKGFAEKIVASDASIPEEEKEATVAEIMEKYGKVNLSEVKLKFNGLTFDENAKNLGATDEEIGKYVEPPEAYLMKMMKYLAGFTVEMQHVRHRDGGATGGTPVTDKMKDHDAFKQFDEKLLQVLKAAGIKFRVSNLKVEEIGSIIEDSLKLALPDFGVAISFALDSRKNGQPSTFSITSWEGPKIETTVRTHAMLQMGELDQLAVELADAKFEGSRFTKDTTTTSDDGTVTTSGGKNILTISDQELNQYFEENDKLPDTDSNKMNMEEKIAVLSQRKNSGKRDTFTVTGVADMMDHSSEEFSKFLNDFKSVLNWKYISKFMLDLPESVMRDFADYIDWKWISTRGDLSDKFVVEFKDKLNLDEVRQSQNLSKKVEKQLV